MVRHTIAKRVHRVWQSSCNPVVAMQSSRVAAERPVQGDQGDLVPVMCVKQVMYKQKLRNTSTHAVLSTWKRRQGMHLLPE